jgi:hypothetical protein
MYDNSRSAFSKREVKVVIEKKVVSHRGLVYHKIIFDVKVPRSFLRSSAIT